MLCCGVQGPGPGDVPPVWVYGERGADLTQTQTRTQGPVVIATDDPRADPKSQPFGWGRTQQREGAEGPEGQFPTLGATPRQEESDTPVQEGPQIWVQKEATRDFMQPTHTPCRIEEEVHSPLSGAMFIYWSHWLHVSWCSPMETTTSQEHRSDARQPSSSESTQSAHRRFGVKPCNSQHNANGHPVVQNLRGTACAGLPGGGRAQGCGCPVQHQGKAAARRPGQQTAPR